MSSYIDNPITECTQPLQWEKIVELNHQICVWLLPVKMMGWYHLTINNGCGK